MISPNSASANEALTLSSFLLSRGGLILERSQFLAAPHSAAGQTMRGLATHCGSGTCSEGYRSVTRARTTCGWAKELPTLPLRLPGRRQAATAHRTVTDAVAATVGLLRLSHGGKPARLPSLGHGEVSSNGR